MLLVSAYENYAIIGDNDEGTERWKGDRVLLKAIRLMETVRDEGEKMRTGTCVWHTHTNIL